MEAFTIMSNQEFHLTSHSYVQVLNQIEGLAPFEIDQISEGRNPSRLSIKFSEPSGFEQAGLEILTVMGEWQWPELWSLLKMAEPEVGDLPLQFRVVKPSSELLPALQIINAKQSKQIKKQFDSEQTPINITSNMPSLSSPGLLVMDMDSTAIQIECIDEIAKLAGVGDQVANVTAQAMRGELDFEQSLHARVATLKGAPVSVIETVANDLPLMPGLEELVARLKAHDWKIAIVSGGFTAMTEALKQQLKLDITIANNLDVEQSEQGATLSGTVSGKVIDAQAKADAVVALAKQYDIPMSQTVAMGDGANDLIMMDVAQLGVAFHAKPLVRQKADASVAKGGLDQLLYFLV